MSRAAVGVATSSSSSRLSAAEGVSLGAGEGRTASILALGNGIRFGGNPVPPRKSGDNELGAVAGGDFPGPTVASNGVSRSSTAIVFLPPTPDCDERLFTGVVFLLMGFVCDRMVVWTGIPPGVGMAFLFHIHDFCLPPTKALSVLLTLLISSLETWVAAKRQLVTVASVRRVQRKGML